MLDGKGIGLLLVFVLVGGLVCVSAEVMNVGKSGDISPKWYTLSVVTTYVETENGKILGQRTHTFWGAGSGKDTYYDQVPRFAYKGGAGLTCSCGGMPDDDCSVNMKSFRLSSITPLDWHGYDRCTYVDEDGCGFIGGTVTASCSTIQGCYISIEWRAFCEER